MSADHAATLRGRRQDLRDAIWTHGPEHFDMSSWVNGPGLNSIEEAAAADLTQCGTTCCIAGHGARLMGGAEWDVAVAEHFGLPLTLFHRSAWSDVRFKDGYLATEIQLDGHWTPTDEWAKALDYLDWLIKEDVAA